MKTTKPKKLTHPGYGSNFPPVQSEGICKYERLIIKISQIFMGHQQFHHKMHLTANFFSVFLCSQRFQTRRSHRKTTKILRASKITPNLVASSKTRRDLNKAHCTQQSSPFFDALFPCPTLNMGFTFFQLSIFQISFAHFAQPFMLSRTQ